MLDELQTLPFLKASVPLTSGTKDQRARYNARKRHGHEANDREYPAGR